MSKQDPIETPQEAETPTSPAPVESKPESTPKVDTLSSEAKLFTGDDLDIGNAQPPAGKVELPPDNVSGADAEKKRGRPKSNKTEDEKKEEKRQRDARYRARLAAEKAGVKTPGSPSSDVPAVKEISEDAQAAAALVMQSLGFVRAVISNGEVDKDLTQDEATKRAIIQEQTHQAWGRYLDDCGAKLPPWATVTVLSMVYVAPALKTPTAREKLGLAFSRVKEWFKRRRG